MSSLRRREPKAAQVRNEQVCKLYSRTTRNPINDESRLQVDSKRREQSVQKLRIGNTFSPHKCRLDRVMNVGECIHAATVSMGDMSFKAIWAKISIIGVKFQTIV